VYAVGDITTYDGKIKLIATATAEAAIAANYAKNYIDPKSKVAPGHSSNRDK
jgi:thioredoxin reductase (NADPH)